MREYYGIEGVDSYKYGEISKILWETYHEMISAEISKWELDGDFGHPSKPIICLTDITCGCLCSPFPYHDVIIHIIPAIDESLMEAYYIQKNIPEDTREEKTVHQRRTVDNTYKYHARPYLGGIIFRHDCEDEIVVGDVEISIDLEDRDTFSFYEFPCIFPENDVQTFKNYGIHVVDHDAIKTFRKFYKSTEM